MTHPKQFKRTLLLTSLLATGALLTGCSGSDDDGSDSGSIQLYNGSTNGPTLTLTIEDVARTSAELGDVTSTHAYNTGDYDVAIQYTNDQGNLTDIYSSDISIQNDEKALLMMYGAIENQQVLQLDLPFHNTDEDTFTLQLVNITEEGKNYDVYMAQDDGVFEQAELVGGAMYLQPTDEMEYDTDNYTFYLTEAGSTTPIWQSEEVSINDEDALVLALRPSFDSNSDYITLDLISDSNSVETLKNVDAQAQVQFYSSIDAYPSVQFQAQKGDDVYQSPITAADTFTDAMALAPNSYSISMLDEQGTTLVDNYLLTLEREQSVLGVFYEDMDYGARMLNVEQNLIPNSVSHEITMINLVDNYNGLPVSKLDFYFTLDGQPISQTEHHLDDVTRYSSDSLSVLDNDYGFYAILEENGQDIVLHQEASVDVTADGNYVLILEADDSTATGYKLTKLHTVIEN